MIDEIKQVCFIGAGTQGCMNSIICSAHGYQSVLYDVSDEVLKAAPTRLQMISGFFAEREIVPKDLLEESLPRIAVVSDLSKAVADADLLNESVPERLELKRKVHKELDELCPPKTIQTTNTSSLLLSDIETSVNRGDKFAAFHFNGGSPLLDITGGPRTSAATIDLLTRFAKSIGLEPVVIQKEKD